MDKDYWLDIWDKGEIGFHQEEYHQALTKFWNQFTNGETGNVLVPLCGKSSDMIFLKESGHRVFGADLSKSAVECFFKENSIQYFHENNFYYNQDFKLYFDDIFNLNSKDFDHIDYIYDRAALVALPMPLRKKYVKWIRANFPKASIFLESFEFGSLELGPPHSISDNEIQANYSDFYKIEHIQLIHAPVESVRVHSGQIHHFHMRTSFLRPK